ncbi:hypothetical protein [Microbacterium sp. 1.5R]|uniref:hypothetical protein n=1 Tax=Microbacterium sp. 1.5R TaxID=1916917 RepID=UPI00119DEBA7|nr:hypothetical protein [Microbacterium sp. 1.5R]
MNDTIASTDERIRSFASAVRQHLDDLPPDELDEIIGGLTADLADQADDNGGMLDLGDPASYAEELRSAAGLPPRGAIQSRPRLGERLLATRQRLTAGIRRNPIGAWLLDLCVTLRPAWWALRGYGLYVLILFVVVMGNGREHWMVPDSLPEWGAVILLGVLSVQWGSGKRLKRSVGKRAHAALNLLAALAVVAALPVALSPRVEYVGQDYPQSGLTLDGVQINNIFAYDENGDLIDRVQLFTGKGTPLDLYGSAGGQLFMDENGEIVDSANGRGHEFGLQDDGLRVTVPAEDYRGRPIWNTYPLDEADLDTRTMMPRMPTLDRPEPPFQKAPRVTPTPEPVDTSSPSSPPEPTPTPVP